MVAPLLTAAAALTTFPVAAQQGAEGPAVRALRDELARSMSDLMLPGAPKPYFVAYRLVERHQHDVTATFGQLTHDGGERGRSLRVEMRVGDARLDNTSFMDLTAGPRGRVGVARTSLEEDYDGVRRDAWFVSDGAYKAAVAMLEKKRAARQLFPVAPDDPGSFSAAAPTKLVETPPPELFARDHAALAKTLSRVFREHSGVQLDRVSIRTDNRRRTFLSSEGSLVSYGTSQIHVSVQCEAQAGDGTVLRGDLSFRGRSPAELPNEAELVAEVRRVASELERARTASVVDEFMGPVLFEGIAAPQLVHRLLAAAVSGTPSPESSSGSVSRFWRRGDFDQRVGQRVLAPGLRLEDDPTIDRLGALVLLGSYRVDGEGVPAQKVLLVEDGFLKTLLMSRTPARGLPRSNGHGRSGEWEVGRSDAAIGNLILTGKAGLPAAQMRRRLFDEVRSARAPFGLIVRQLEHDGGQGRPSVRAGGGPVLAGAIVTPDGKEQPVRGADLRRLDHRSLRDVLAVGKELAAWHAEIEDGELATVVAPALLLKGVLVERAPVAHAHPPLSQHPHFAGKTGAPAPERK